MSCICTVGDDVNNDFFPAVRANNLDLVKDLLNRHPEWVRATIPVNGRTPLHVAVLAGHLDMVTLLLRKMDPDDLEVEACGFTAFAEAVRQRTPKDTLEKMVGENPRILEKPDGDGLLPVARAFNWEYSEIASYLYSVTPSQALLDPQRDSVNGATVLCSSIIMEQFDIACDLIREQSTLAFALDFQRKSSFFALASSSLAFPDKVDPIKNEHSMRLLSAMCDVVRTLKEGDEKIVLIHEAVLEAADRGIVMFIEAIAKANPDILASCVDRKTGMNVFQRAIRARHITIFYFLLSLPFKEAMFSHCDKCGNHALHVAGMIAPPNVLSVLPGSAQRMQNELQWFKEVEKRIPKFLRDSKNKKHMTGREVFTATHRGLFREAETWIRDTSSFGIVAAALVITVMFTAVITVPGGTDEKTGFPIFRDKSLFEFFMFMDILSVVSATASLFHFLSVTKRGYKEEDFLKDLPVKITRGVGLLCISFETMVVAFWCVVILMFTSDRAMSSNDTPFGVILMMIILVATQVYPLVFV